MAPVCVYWADSRERSHHVKSIFKLGDAGDGCFLFLSLSTDVRFFLKTFKQQNLIILLLVHYPVVTPQTNTHKRRKNKKRFLLERNNSKIANKFTTTENLIKPDLLKAVEVRERFFMHLFSGWRQKRDSDFKVPDSSHVSSADNVIRCEFLR